MSLPQIPVVNLDDPSQRRAVRERINGILSHQFDDSRVRTAAEIAAGVTPVNYAYEEGNVLRYGAPSDGTGDCSTAFANAVSVGGSGRPIIIPQGTYRFPDGWVITSARREIICQGHVTIHRPSGAGAVLLIDSGSDTTRLDGVKQRGTLILRGGADVDYCLRMRGVARSTFDDIRAIDCTDAAFRLEWCGLNRFNKLTCSDNVDTFATNPTFGLHLTRTTAARESFANEFSSLVIESPVEVGAYFEYAIYNHILSGTLEGVDNGMVIATDSRNNTLSSVDFESNAAYDMEVIGDCNTFINCNLYSAGSGGTLLLSSGATSNSFIGGFVRAVSLNAAAVETVFVGTQVVTGGVSGSGNYWTFGCSYVNGTTFAFESASPVGFGQSASAAAILDNGTITTAGVTVARVAPAAARTGVILQAGTVPGQKVVVINESTGANSLTFATAATSNVADGTSSVVAGLKAAAFYWDTSTSRWYSTQ